VAKNTRFFKCRKQQCTVVDASRVFVFYYTTKNTCRNSHHGIRIRYKAFSSITRYFFFRISKHFL